MILNILLLIIGFVLLIKGADFFVDGASSTAQNFKVSKMLIGLTIIAFGTSAPEFAVSIQSLANGSTDMLLGNVIGSNIINVLLILGVAAVIHPIKIKENTVQKELPLCLLISMLLVVLFLDIKLANGIVNEITRSDAIVILLFFTVFLYYLFSLARKKKEDKDDEKPPFKLGKSLLLVGFGLVGIIIGSNMVVNNATSIATKIGLSERLIALTIIAFGTSLPELVTTIVSSKKGEQDLLLGNIIGSNIFNACVVLGIPVALFGTITPGSFNYIDLIVLIGSSMLLFIFAETKRTITRLEGILMLLVFIAYYIMVFVI
jgi:cation:H+ antiporter